MSDHLTELTAEIVSAFVANNNVRREDLAELIASTYSALSRTSTPAEPEAAKAEPAIAIKKSITPDYLISLEDGKRYKSLKRHLGGRGMTPTQYREKWGLKADYPMVAPNYAKQRSELALALGLGRMRKNVDEAKPASKTPAKRAAPRKAKGQSAETTA